MKLKRSVYYPLSFVIFLMIFYILSNASIGMVVYPFAVAFMFALVWVNQKAWIVCPAYLVGSLLFDFSFVNIICSICAVLVLLIPYYLHIFVRKNIKLWEFCIYCGVAYIPNLIFEIYNNGNFYFNIVSLICGVLFFVLSIQFLEVLFIKGLSLKLNILEYISGGVFLVVLSDGLTFLSLGPFSFLKLFVSFVILFIGYSSKSYYAVFASALLGFGSLLGMGNPVYIAPFMIWAMFISPFKSYKKYLMPVALIVSECLSEFCFDLYYNYSPWEIAPILASCLIFLLIPEKIYDKIRMILRTKPTRIAIKDVVNRNREVLEKRLGYLSDIFADMDRSFRKLTKNSLSKQEIQDVLKRELRLKVCENCANFNRCQRVYTKEIEDVYDEISEIAFEKGRINILDLPSFLNSHCSKTTAIISSVNTICEQYRRYSELVGSVDLSKLLIADEFYGISNIFKKLSNEVSVPISFDCAREDKILQELLFNDVICDDIVVFERDIHILEVSLLVRNEDKDKTLIPKIVGKICGVEMCVQEVVNSLKPGWTTLLLKTAPKFDCLFGISSKSKNNASKSGDCHSVIKLDSDKFMFALCDGMGSGEKAEEISSVAIDMVENFYKAGFESDVIMSSVNKLLSIQQQDVFSAVDLCVVDLKIGFANFVKMGAPACFLVKNDECRIIDGGALPVGIVSEGVPAEKKEFVDSGDFIVLVTDGISDSFESDEALGEYICSLKDKNPQAFSDKILQKALENSGEIAKDDMTVLVIKIL